MSVSRIRAGRVVGILVSTIFAVFAFSSLAHASGEFEPNESRANPAGPIAPGSTISATIDSWHDADWYKFYVASPNTTVKFTATKTNAVAERWHVEFVEDTAGDYISAHSLTDETSYELTGTVPPGKYYAYVSGNPDTDASGLTYTLKFTQGLSSFQAIQSGCTTSKSNVASKTAAVNSATAALTSALAAANKAIAASTKAGKALSKAKKKKAKGKKAKKAKAKAIAKAKKAVKKAKSAVTSSKAGATAAQSKLTDAQFALQQAQEDSDSLCSVKA